MSRKGFTLVELMVVVLIVGILAAVAIPLMTGKIDAAKWSEAKAAAGTIASALRAYGAEKGTGGDWATISGAAMTSATVQGYLGVTGQDLTGTYFSPECYTITSASWNAVNGLTATITVNAAASTRPNPPTSTPTSRTLIITNGSTNTTTSTIM